MKKLVLAVFAACVFMIDMAVATQDAGAVVCARGVYRAGCAGPHGAVVARRPAYRSTTVVRRRY